MCIASVTTRPLRDRYRKWGPLVHRVRVARDELDVTDEEADEEEQQQPEGNPSDPALAAPGVSVVSR